MNIALPALAILLGLLPGIAFYYSYFAGRFEKRRVGVSVFEEVGCYVVFSIPLDSLAYLICRKIGIDFDVNLGAHLVAGNLPEHAIQTISTSLRDHALLTATVYMSILAGSAALG